MQSKNKTSVQISESIILWEHLSKALKIKLRQTKFSQSSFIQTGYEKKTYQFLINNYFPMLRALDKNSVFPLGKARLITTENINKNFSLNVDSHHVKLKSKLFKEYISFILKWTVLLISLLLPNGKKQITSDYPASIFYGCIDGFQMNQNRLNSISDFINNSKIQSLQKNSYYFFQSSKIYEKKSSNLFITLFPEALFISKCNLNLLERVHAIIIHIFGFFICHLKWLKHPIMMHFASEFASLNLLLFADRKLFISSVIYSTSNASRHHIFAYLAKNAEIHHIYYNIVPSNPTLKSDPKPHKAKLDEVLLASEIGKKWVWTKPEKIYLEKYYNHDNVDVLGIPKLFYNFNCLPEAKQKTFDIVIFDVTPYQNQLIENLKILFYYGNSDTAISLITKTDFVLSSFQEKFNLKFALKTKRKNLKVHDERYFSVINNLDKNNNNFKLLLPDVEIMELFHPDTILISRPYTSPGYIGALLGCKSIYFDPTEELVDVGINHENLYFASGEKELRKLISQFLNCKHNESKNA